ncbi:hypothetical protein [Candidatus Chloroploca sp. Khr17]|uniref:hypothetical protein n=1 Tax=Candidatus Chloroploca sp. Khr17 TaxID=2496869 RepID=UPI00101D5DD1|nr:hypothetical protein [Candidatus Chloroploca sp. Khr17]
MQYLSPPLRAWLKGFHILFASAWVGAALCMTILTFVGQPASGEALYAGLLALQMIDNWVIIPAAIGSLLTGLLISWRTPWGFFKWRWVTLKWIGTVAMILFGSFFLGPWLNGMVAIAAADPLVALQDPTFLRNQSAIALSVAPQVLLLLTLIFISVLKPWKRAAKR